MLRSIFRTGVVVGSISAAVYIAKKYFGSDFDKALESVKSTAKDIGSDMKRQDKAVTDSLER